VTCGGEGKGRSLNIVSRLRIPLAITFLCLFWGGGWLFMKIGLRDLPPFLYLGARQLLVGVLFLALCLWQGVRLPAGKALIRSFGLGMVMTGFSNGLMFWGLQYIDSGLASILFATMPFFAAGLAYLWLKEDLNVGKIAGIALGFVGVVLLLSDKVSGQSRQALWGESALLLAALSWAAPLVLMKRWLSQEDPFALTGVQMLAGAVFLLPLGLVIEGLARVHITVSALLALAYMTFLAGAGGFSLYYWLASQMTATKLSLTSFIVPGVAVVLGVAFLGEAINPRLFLGLGFIAAGITLTNLMAEDKKGPALASQGSRE